MYKLNSQYMWGISVGRAFPLERSALFTVCTCPRLADIASLVQRYYTDYAIQKCAEGTWRVRHRRPLMKQTTMSALLVYDNDVCSVVCLITCTLLYYNYSTTCRTWVLKLVSVVATYTMLLMRMGQQYNRLTPATNSTSLWKQHKLIRRRWVTQR